MLYTNQECQFTTTPDAIFASNEAFRSDRVWLTGGPHTLDTEWMGTPDLVIEVVSQWSEDKDTEWLMSAYWNAGIPEYWVIDARKDPLRFDILKRKGKEYTPTRRIGGWVKSAVLGRSFRLVAFTNQLGHPDYTLEVR
jgi:Uma2 family endonuclease